MLSLIGRELKMNTEPEFIIVALIVIVSLAGIMLMLNLLKAKERAMFDFNSNQSPEELVQSSRWYRKPMLVILAIILFLPVGLYGLYKQHEENKRRRMLII